MILGIFYVIENYIRTNIKNRIRDGCDIEQCNNDQIKYRDIKNVSIKLI